MEQEITKIAVTFSGVIVSLIPVIIGGFLAIGGALSGTLLTYFLNEKSQRKLLKRKNIENLLNAANRAEHWLDEYKNTKFGLYTKDIGPSPIAEVKYLNKLYVHELNAEVTRLALVSAQYFSLIASCYKSKLETGSIPDSFLTEYEPIIN
jgi:hypothetical protein